MNHRSLAIALVSVLSAVLPAACGTVVSMSPEGQGAIDDLEDGDALIEAHEGRIGYWYTEHDRSQGHMGPWPFAPTFGGAENSRYAAAAYGGGFNEWGAKLGVFLQFPQGGALASYDASEFTGIRFDARGNVPIRVAVATADALDVAVGGACSPSATTPCNDYYGTHLTVAPKWGSYEIPFDVFAQAGWGKATAFNEAHAVAIEFQVDKGLEFDFAVDNVRLY